MGNAGGCLASASAWGVARVCGHQPRVLCTSRQLRQVLGGGPEAQGSDTGPGYGIAWHGEEKSNAMRPRNRIQRPRGRKWDMRSGRQLGPSGGQVGQGKGCLGKPKFLFCAANLRPVSGSFTALCMRSIGRCSTRCSARWTIYSLSYAVGTYTT